MIVAYIFSWFLDLDSILGNIPYFSLEYFEIYRLIFSPFVGNSIIDVIILLFMYPTMAKSLETSIGSAAFLFLIFELTLVTNILFCVICLLMWAMGMQEAMVTTGYALIIIV
jgi:hypothetical protein